MKHLLAGLLLTGACLACAGMLYGWYVTHREQTAAVALRLQAEGDARRAQQEQEKAATLAKLLDTSLNDYAGKSKDLAAKVTDIRNRAGHLQDVMWKVVFSDSFDGDALDPRWKIVAGDWDLGNGRIQSRDLSNHNVLAMKNEIFAGDVQVSYDCRTVRCYNGGACDMSLGIAMQDDAPLNVTSGYFFRFGSFDNTFSGLSREDATPVRNPTVRVTPGKMHRVVVQRLNGRFSMLVDGKPVFLYQDRAPFGALHRGMAAFYFYRCVVEIDQVMVRVPVYLQKELHPHFRKGIRPLFDPDEKAVTPPPAPRDGGQNDIF